VIQGITTALRIDESRVFTVWAAELGMTKGQILRAALRYVLTHSMDFQKWLSEQYGVTDYDWRPKRDRSYPRR